MDAYLYYMEYDYTAQRPGKYLEDGAAFAPDPEVEARLKSEFDKNLRAAPKPEARTYDKGKLRIARLATDYLRADAGQVGGKLVCAVKARGYYTISLHLESPYYFFAEAFDAAAYRFLAGVVDAADTVCITCDKPGWLQFEFALPLFCTR